LQHFRHGVHWSFMQVEYATDVVFRKQAKFQSLYEAIVRTAVHVVKAEHVASFLGRKPSAHDQGEVGNDCSRRIQAPASAITWAPPASSFTTRPGSSRAWSAPPTVW
jgi:hypothetical protein